MPAGPVLFMLHWQSEAIKVKTSVFFKHSTSNEVEPWILFSHNWKIKKPTAGDLKFNNKAWINFTMNREPELDDLSAKTALNLLHLLILLIYNKKPNDPTSSDNHEDKC